MLGVILMWEPNGIVALIFLPTTSESCKESYKFLSLHLLKRCREVKHIILRFERLFTKTLVSYILKTKAIFVNPGEHEY